MKHTYSYILTDKAVRLILKQGKFTYTKDITDTNEIKKIILYIATNNLSKLDKYFIAELIHDIVHVVDEHIVTIRNAHLIIDGTVVISNNMLRQMTSFKTQKSLINFAKNLALNTDERILNAIGQFLNRLGLKVDNDGYIIAYRSWRLSHRFNSGNIHKLSPRIDDDGSIYYNINTDYFVGSYEFAASVGLYHEVPASVRVHPKDILRLDKRAMLAKEYQLLDINM